MTAAGYARGVSGLAAYLGMDPKSARKILRHVTIPRIEIPGVVRATILYKLSDVDEALAAFRAEPAERKSAGVDVDRIVSEVLGPRRARGAAR